MAFLIGAVLAISVGLVMTLIGLDRDRAFYPTVMIVIASYRGTAMQPDTATYNQSLNPADKQICDLLAREIGRALPDAENKIWHAHPVWFPDGHLRGVACNLDIAACSAAPTSAG